MPNLPRAIPRPGAEYDGPSQSPFGLMKNVITAADITRDEPASSQRNRISLFAALQRHCPTKSWSYEVLTVWMPHSVLALPRQRPARASSSGEVRLVQGMHPTDR